jgi:hypothetical protein
MAVCLLAWWSVTAFAQLDPLLFVKRVPPTIIIAFDTSFRMLDDGQGNIYDTNFYNVSDNPALAAELGINTLTTKTYLRRYEGLLFEAVQDATTKYEATEIEGVAAVWDPSNPLTSNSPTDLAFWAPTRYYIARAGLAQAVSENAANGFRWGLVKHRQTGEAWRVPPGCDQPVRVTGDADLALLTDTDPPCAVNAPGKYGIYVPTVASANYSNEGAPGDSIMVAPATNTAAAVGSLILRPFLDPLGLIPASADTRTYQDRPLSHLLDDVKTAASAAMAADSAANRSCRNTVAVLVVAGKEEGDAAYMSSHDAAGVASTFTAVSGGGVTRRVPIVVVAIKPAAADEVSLRLIAANSGGAYFNVSDASGVARAVNHATQLGFGRSTDFDAGTVSEFQSVSPIVGTVNMVNGQAADGSVLPNTDITAIPGGQALPQRSNVIITAGFGLPGFEGKLRAFRTYRPEVDNTKPTGWKFVNDGTRLWPDIDGDRPELAGLARAPKDPNTRNIYTYIPNGAGGGTVVAFTLANAVTLQPHLGGASPATLIPYVRSLPIGAVIGSTPALMDPPSLDPPPDDDYGRTDAPGTFAGDHKDRRSIIFFGANDGMIHAVDARTGFEVWAFIPYNLLPKLRTLYDGQPVGTFDYFVDSSPKIAEVKLSGAWRSMLIIGQGPGGIFYQAFDVTEAGMGVAPDQDDLGAVSGLLQRFDQPDESIIFKWAFPNYSNFNPAYTATFSVNDGTAGGRIRLYGDLKATATTAEKSVGFTWSDPAVGPLDVNRTVNVVIAGSGYFPAIEDSIPARGPTAPRAGQTLYLINLADGTLLGNPAGGACLGTGCLDVGEIANGRKNALQADPTAAGDVGSPTVKKAYLGDLDGKYWRFDFTETGGITKAEMVDSGQPIYASSALLFVGSTDVYMFFSTGSDILPPSASGGTGTFKLWGLKDNFPGVGATTKFSRDLATVSSSGGLVTGERPSTAPSVAGDIVFYTTTVEDAAAPCSDFSARLYGLTFIGGAAYDSNGNGTIDNNENPVAKTVAGRATAPFIVDQHLYFGASGATGSNVESFGDPEDFNNGVGQVGVRILSWREIR